MKRGGLVVLLTVTALACSKDDTKGAEDSGVGPGVSGNCTEKDCGPDAVSFFDNNKVAELRLTVDPAALQAAGKTADQWQDLLWDKWNNHCGPYDWVSVRMEYVSPDGLGNVALDNVGMRMRGTKSRGQNPLAGFKLDFNNLLPEGTSRRFADLGRMELLSNENDPSEMLQCMTYKLIRDTGIQAPRCNHLRVYVNGKLYGLMENVERAKDSRFLKHHFATSEGSFYAASSTCGWADSMADLAFKGDQYAGVYDGIYEILKGAPADAEANLIPMLKCGDVATTPDDAAFKSCIKEWIDVDQWLKLIAAESAIPTVEDFVGTRRNFFLYFQPAANTPHGGIMRVWGWDYDTSLMRSACYPNSCDLFTGVAGWYGPLGTRAPFIKRLTKVFKAEYCAAVESFITNVFTPDKVDQMEAVIKNAMSADPVFTYQQWQEGVTDKVTEKHNKGVREMRQHFIDRAVRVRELLEISCKNVGVPEAGADTGVGDAALDVANDALLESGANEASTGTSDAATDTGTSDVASDAVANDAAGD